MNIIPLFCEIDDCFLVYEKQRFPTDLSEIPDVSKKRGRPRSLHTSEMMTILIAFQQSQYRTLKHFYLKHVCRYWHSAFPNLVSYNRFVERIPETLGPLTVYLAGQMGKAQDSPSLIQRSCPSARTGVSRGIVFFRESPSGRELHLDGFMGSNFI